MTTDVAVLRMRLDLLTDEFDRKHALVKQRVNNLEKSAVAPKVDAKQLHDLNRLYDQKLAHHRQVATFVAANPIAPTVDTRNLTAGINRVRAFKAELAAVKSQLGSMGADIGTSVDQRVTVDFGRFDSRMSYEIRSLHNDISKDFGRVVDAIAGLKPSLISRVAGFGFKVATAPLRVAGSLAAQTAGNVFTGFTEDIGRTLFQDMGQKRTLDASRQMKKFATILDKEIIGRDKAYATFFAEFFRSGSIEKAFSRAIPRSEAGKIYERLMKLQEIVTAPTPKKGISIINKDPELKEVFKQSGGDFRKFLELAQPTALTEKIVNPIVQEFQPLLRFIQDIRAARTAMESQKFYNERKAAFPVLDQYSSLVNVSGGAQFKGGQGGRSVAMGLEMLAPNAYFMPVENPDSDFGNNPNQIEQWFKETILKNIPGMSGEFINTTMNAVRQTTDALNPFGYSTAAAQSLANTRLANEQNVQGSMVTFSLGGKEGIDYANAQSYLGLGSSTLAMNYPFLNLANRVPQGFNAGVGIEDPLSFPMLLGLGFNAGGTYQQSASGRTIGSDAHHYKHILKNTEFLQLFYRTIGQEMPDLSKLDRTKILEAGEKLYQLIGAAEQMKSLATTGAFNSDSPFNNFVMGAEDTKDVNTEQVMARFFEWNKAVPQLLTADNPEVKKVGESLKQYFEGIQELVFAKLREINYTLPSDLGEMVGYQKFQSDAGQINWWTGELLAGINPRQSMEDLPIWADEIQNQTIPWFNKTQQKNLFGEEYVKKITEAYRQFIVVLKEFVRTGGKIDASFAESINIPKPDAYTPEVEDFLFNQRLRPGDLPKEEVARVTELGVPKPFQQKQSAILAFNQLQKAIPTVLPNINQIQGIGVGMSGAVSLLGQDLVYKTDLDPEGLSKVASPNEVKAYEALQGRLSPLLYQAEQGKALVTERIQGRPLKDILDRLAQPYKKLQEQRAKLEEELSQSEDPEQIRRLGQELDAVRAKAKRESERFNKAAGILYKQVGQLGAALQAMGVVHNDLASGNVFFAQGGPMAIDLGNAEVIQPGQTTLTPMQRFGDFATSVQRSVIDRDYYGLLNPLSAAGAIVSGYSNPLPLPQPRQIDPSLLTPAEVAEPVQLGTTLPSLLFRTIDRPQFQAVPTPQPFVAKPIPSPWDDPQTKPTNPVVGSDTGRIVTLDDDLLKNVNKNEWTITHSLHRDSNKYLAEIAAILARQYGSSRDDSEGGSAVPLGSLVPRKPDGGAELVVVGDNPPPDSPPAGVLALPDNADIRKGLQTAIWTTMDSLKKYYGGLADAEKEFLSKIPKGEQTAGLIKALLPAGMIGGGLAEAGLLDDYVLGFQHVFEHIFNAIGSQGIDVLMQNVDKDVADILQAIYNTADSTLKTDATGFGSGITNALNKLELDLLRKFLNMIKGLSDGGQATAEAVLRGIAQVGSDVAGQVVGDAAALGTAVVAGELGKNVAKEGLGYVETNAVIEQAPAADRTAIKGSSADETRMAVKSNDVSETRTAVKASAGAYKKSYEGIVGSYDLRRTLLKAGGQLSAKDLVEMADSNRVERFGLSGIIKSGEKDKDLIPDVKGADGKLRSGDNALQVMRRRLGSLDTQFVRIMKQLVAQAKEAGLELPAGLEEGIKQYSGRMEATAKKELGVDLIKTIKDVFGIASPAKVFMGIGKNTIEGQVQGVKDAAPRLLLEYVKLAENVALVYRATLEGVVTGVELKKLPESSVPRYPQIPAAIEKSNALQSPKLKSLQQDYDATFDSSAQGDDDAYQLSVSQKHYDKLADIKVDYPDVVGILNTEGSEVEWAKARVRRAEGNIAKNEADKADPRNQGMESLQELFAERTIENAEELEKAKINLDKAIQKDIESKKRSIKDGLEFYYSQLRLYRLHAESASKQISRYQERLNQKRAKLLPKIVEEKTRLDAENTEKFNTARLERKQGIVGSLSQYYADKRDYEKRLSMGAAPSPFAGAARSELSGLVAAMPDMTALDKALQAVFKLKAKKIIESFLSSDSRITVNPEIAAMMAEMEGAVSHHINELVALKGDEVLSYSIDATGAVNDLTVKRLSDLEEDDLYRLNTDTDYTRQIGWANDTTDRNQNLLDIINLNTKYRKDYKPDQSLIATKEQFSAIEVAAQRIDEDIAGWGEHGEKAIAKVREGIAQVESTVLENEVNRLRESYEQKLKELVHGFFAEASDVSGLAAKASELKFSSIKDILGWARSGFEPSDAQIQQLYTEKDKHLDATGENFDSWTRYQEIDFAVNATRMTPLSAGVDKKDYNQYLKDKQMAAAAVIKHQMSGMGMLGKTKLLAQVPVELIPVITSKANNAVFAETFQRLQDEAYAAGAFVGIGLGDGIEASVPEGVAATKKLTGGVINTAKDEFEIQSPSRVFMRIGKYIVEGLQQGISVNTLLGNLQSDLQGEIDAMIAETRNIRGQYPAESNEDYQAYRKQQADYANRMGQILPDFGDFFSDADQFISGLQTFFQAMGATIGEQKVGMADAMQGLYDARWGWGTPDDPQEAAGQRAQIASQLVNRFANPAGMFVGTTPVNQPAPAPAPSPTTIPPLGSLESQSGQILDMLNSGVGNLSSAIDDAASTIANAAEGVSQVANEINSLEPPPDPWVSENDISTAPALVSSSGSVSAYGNIPLPPPPPQNTPQSPTPVSSGNGVATTPVVPTPTVPFTPPVSSGAPPSGSWVGSPPFGGSGGGTGGGTPTIPPTGFPSGFPSDAPSGVPTGIVTGATAGSGSGGGTGGGTPTSPVTGASGDNEPDNRRIMRKASDWAVRRAERIPTNKIEEFFVWFNQQLDNMESAAAEAGEGVRGLGRVIATLEEKHPGVRRLVGTIRDIGAGILFWLGLDQIDQLLVNFAQSSVDAALQVERFKVALSYDLSGSGLSGLQKMRELSKEIGSNFLVTAENYSKLVIAAANTNIAPQVDAITTGFTKALVAQGATPEEQSRAFLAVQQMIGKNQIMGEELRQQLAEVMPQVTGALARAKGVSQQQLVRDMQNTPLLPEEDLLPLAKQLEYESTIPMMTYKSGPLPRVAGIQNEYQRMQQGAGEALLGIADVGGLQAANAVLGLLADNIKILTASAALLGIEMTRRVIVAMLRFGSGTRIASLLLKTLGLEFLTFNSVAAQWNNTIGMANKKLYIMGGVAGAATGAMSLLFNVMKMAAPFLAISAGVALISKVWGSYRTELVRVAEQHKKTLEQLSKKSQKPELSPSREEGEDRGRWNNWYLGLGREGLNSPGGLTRGFFDLVTLGAFSFDRNRPLLGFGDTLDEDGNKVKLWERQETLSNRRAAGQILDQGEGLRENVQTLIETGLFDQLNQEMLGNQVRRMQIRTAQDKAVLDPSTAAANYFALNKQMADALEDQNKILESYGVTPAALEAEAQVYQSAIEELEDQLPTPENESKLEQLNQGLTQINSMLNLINNSVAGVNVNSAAINANLQRVDMFGTSRRAEANVVFNRESTKAINDYVNGRIDVVQLQFQQQAIAVNKAENDARIAKEEAERALQQFISVPRFGDLFADLLNDRDIGINLDDYDGNVARALLSQSTETLQKVAERSAGLDADFAKWAAIAVDRLTAQVEAEKNVAEQYQAQKDLTEQRLVELAQIQSNIKLLNTNTKIDLDFNSGNIGEPAVAVKKAIASLQKANEDLANAIDAQRKIQSEGDAAKLQEAVAQANAQVKAAESAVIQSQRGLEDAYRGQRNAIEDYNQNTIEAVNQINRQLRDFDWEKKDTSLQFARETRELSEAWEDLMFALDDQLIAAQDALADSQDRVSQIQRRIAIEESSPFSQNIGRRAMSIVADFLDGIDSSESTTRSLNQENRTIAREYINNLKNIRNEIERQYDAERERSRTLIRLNEKYMDMLNSVDKAVLDSQRQREDLIANTQRTAPEKTSAVAGALSREKFNIPPSADLLGLPQKAPPVPRSPGQVLPPAPPLPIPPPSGEIQGQAAEPPAEQQYFYTNDPIDAVPGDKAGPLPVPAPELPLPVPAPPVAEPKPVSSNPIQLPKGYEALQKLTDIAARHPLFDPNTEKGMVALVINSLIAGTELLGFNSKIPVEQFATAKGGSNGVMTGYGQYRPDFHPQAVGSLQRMMTNTGEIIHGQRPLPNSKGVNDFATELLLRVKNNLIPDSKALIDFMKSDGAASLAGTPVGKSFNWQGLYDGWTRNPGLADFFVDFLNKQLNEIRSQLENNAQTISLNFGIPESIELGQYAQSTQLKPPRVSTTPRISDLPIVPIPAPPTTGTVFTAPSAPLSQNQNTPAAQPVGKPIDTKAVYEVQTPDLKAIREAYTVGPTIMNELGDFEDLSPVEVQNPENAFAKAEEIFNVRLAGVMSQREENAEQSKLNTLQAYNSFTSLFFELQSKQMQLYNNITNRAQQARDRSIDAKGYVTDAESIERAVANVAKQFRDLKVEAIETDRSLQQEIFDSQSTIDEAKKMIEEGRKSDGTPLTKEEVTQMSFRLEKTKEFVVVLESQRQALWNIAQAESRLEEQTRRTTREMETRQKILSGQQAYAGKLAELHQTRYDAGAQNSWGLGTVLNPAPVVRARMDALTAEDELLQLKRRKVLSDSEYERFSKFQKEINELNISRAFVEAVPGLEAFSSELRSVILESENLGTAARKMANVILGIFTEALVIKPLQNWIGGMVGSLLGYNSDSTKPIATALGQTSGEMGKDNPPIFNEKNAAASIDAIGEYDDSIADLELTEEIASESFSAGLLNATIALEAFIATLQRGSALELVSSTTSITGGGSGILGAAVQGASLFTGAFSGSGTELSLGDLTLSPYSAANANAFDITGVLSNSSFGVTSGIPNFAVGGFIKEAMQKEQIMSGGKQPILAVLNTDEYVIPANEANEYLNYRSWKDIKTGDVEVKNYAKGGFVKSGQTLNNSTTNQRNNTNNSNSTNNFYNNTTITVKNPNDIGLSARQIERRRKLAAERAML